MAIQPERDDIDDFFAAAEKSDPEAMRRAADNLGAPRAEEARPAAQAPADLREDDFLKFLAVETEEADDPDAPFKVVPVRITSVLPWWAWVSMGSVLAGLFVALLLLPGLRLNNKTSRLTGGNYAKAQSAMRDLILTGDERTVDKLFEMASASEQTIDSRLRAVDALAVMREPAADRALLRLEVAERTDERVRRAAVNARRQRQASMKGPDAD